MKKAVILIGFFCFLTTIGFTQKDRDYILTLHKDTVFGSIKINPDVEHISFTHKRKRIYFHPKTLQAFGLYNKKEKTYKVYKSIKNARGKSMFVEVLSEGVVKLYKYKEAATEQNKMTNKELYFIGKKDGKLATMTQDSYELTMRILVKDYPELVTIAEKISYNEVPSLVESYNQYRD